MDLKEFDKLKKRDFENGAVIDEIRMVFKRVMKLESIIEIALNMDGTPDKLFILCKRCYLDEHGEVVFTE